MSLNTVRWGILGAGKVARQFAMGLRLVPGAELTAVASRTEERARLFAADLRIPRWFTQSAELAAAGDVDVVYVATPNHLHREHALLCLEAGKAVLCEKPFSINATEAQEIVETARRREVFCMEGMWMRFLPALRRLESALPEIGEPRLLTAQLGHPFELDPANRLFDPRCGGGALLDLGVYAVSLAVRLFGEPADVLGHAALAESGVDEQAAATLRFPDGSLASLTASLRAEGANEAVVLGTRGRLRIHAPLYCPDRISLARFTQRSHGAESEDGALSRLKTMPVVASTGRRLKAAARRLLGRGEASIYCPFAGNGYHYEAAEAMRCLGQRRLESEIMPLDESLTVMRVLDAIRERIGVRYPSDAASTVKA